MGSFSAEFEKGRALHRQISSHVRSLLSSGDLAPGSKLPSTHALAATWRTTSRTVHVALTALVKEGVLTRVPGRGTFVRSRTQRLTCVAMYYTSNIWGTGGSSFQKSVHAAMQNRLDKHGSRFSVWVDSRPIAEQGRPWAPFVEAAQRREFQAVVTDGTSWHQLKWLNALPVPSAHVTTANIPNKVSFDLPHLIRSSLQRLARQGCRSVGFIAPILSCAKNPDGSLHDHVAWIESFVDTARDLKLAIRNEWIRVLEKDLDLSHERFGFDEFNAVWRQPKRPQGLLVCFDVSSRGAIAAILANRVRVPEELKVVFHKNAGTDLICPLPATLAITEEKDVAAALLHQVRIQAQGKGCKPISFSCRLVDAQRHR